MSNWFNTATIDWFVCLKASLVAQDNGSPMRSGNATLIVNILRNKFPPIFVDPPSVTINRNQGVGSNIYQLTATDADIQVSTVDIRCTEDLCNL